MKKYIYIFLSFLVIGTGGCSSDSDFLDISPTSILSNEQAFSDPAQVLSILANLYNRQVDITSFNNSWSSFVDFGESFPSDGNYSSVQNNGWGYGTWGMWDYGYIRDLNLFIKRDSAATALSVVDKARFSAEARFLRANYYFEMTKRMGGVPLILEPLLYDFNGDPSYLRKPRAKEYEMYDFIIREAEAIKNDLPANLNDRSRASKGAVLAMEARAALYAASIAKYGANTPVVKLSGDEVGIPASKADGYYQIALRAAKEIMSGSAGGYALYQNKPDLAENFANLFLDKEVNNKESIFIEDYKLKTAKVHNFTTSNQPFSSGEESANGDAGRINPSLNLVENFEKLDNTFAPIPHQDANGKPIYYNNPIDIFAGRDARLAGTVILPGSAFKGQQLDIWAGYKLSNGQIVTNQDASRFVALPNTSTPIQVLGKDGPYNGNVNRTQTGFYIRKYLDPTPGAGSRGTNSAVAFIRYRYAEVLLNAAEAAFELGLNADAANYINQVRARAGLVIPLKSSEITFDRIVHERRVELAYEGHFLFDMKRWRLAHIVWDGGKMTASELISNIGKSTKRNTQPFGLWPYKFYDPTSPNNGKWVFDVVLPNLVTGANNFQFGNYYSAIDNNIIAANPKLIRQPNQ